MKSVRQTVDTSTTTDADSASSSTASKLHSLLRTSSYAEGAAALSPNGDGAGGDSQATNETTSDTQVNEPGKDEKGKPLSRKKSKARLEQLLAAAFEAPLTEAERAEAGALVGNLGKKDAPVYQERLQIRLASDADELELEQLLDAANLISKEGITRVNKLLGGKALLQGRGDPFQAKLKTAIAGRAVELELTDTFDALGGAVTSEAIAAAETSIKKLDPKRQTVWRAKLATQLAEAEAAAATKANDAAEAAIEAILGTGERLTTKQQAAAKAEIAKLTNGEQEAWTAKLDARVGGAKTTIYASQLDNKSQTDTDSAKKLTKKEAKIAKDTEAEKEFVELKIAGNTQCNVTALAMQIMQLYGNRETANTAALQLLTDKGFAGAYKGKKVAELQLEEMLLTRIISEKTSFWNDAKIDGKGIVSSSTINSPPQERAKVLTYVANEFIGLKVPGKGDAAGIESVVASTAYAEKGDGGSGFNSSETARQFLTRVKENNLDGENWTGIIGTYLTHGGHIVTLVDIVGEGVILNDPHGFAYKSGAKNYVMNGDSIATAKTKTEGLAGLVERRTKYNGSLSAMLQSTPEAMDHDASQGAWGSLSFYNWDEVEQFTIGRWASVALGKKDAKDADGS